MCFMIAQNTSFFLWVEKRLSSVQPKPNRIETDDAVSPLPYVAQPTPLKSLFTNAMEMYASHQKSGGRLAYKLIHP